MREVVQLVTSKLGLVHPQNPLSIQVIAYAKIKLGYYRVADVMFESSLEEFEARLRGCFVYDMRPMIFLSSLPRMQGRYDEAEARVRENLSK